MFCMICIYVCILKMLIFFYIIFKNDELFFVIKILDFIKDDNTLFLV